MTNITRDWLHPWNPKDEFVFLRRMEGMLDGDAMPGDRVTPAMRAHIGLGGLMAFWKAGVITVAPDNLPSETPPQASGALTPAPLKKKRGRPSKADLAARAAGTTV